MATAYPIPAAATPIERILCRFDRKQIEDFIEVAISLLDVANDPDLEEDDPTEANGDEHDGNPAEDEFCVHRGSGPGCPIADPDKGADDEGEATNEDGGDAVSAIRPEYGDDQTKGPINLMEALSIGDSGGQDLI